MMGRKKKLNPQNIFKALKARNQIAQGAALCVKMQNNER